MKKYQAVSIICSILIVVVATLMGCSSEVQAGGYSDFGRLKEVRFLDSAWGSIEGHLVVDTQTGVEYWLIEPTSKNGGGCSLTLLVDQEGKPLIWKGE